MAKRPTKRAIAGRGGGERRGGKDCGGRTERESARDSEFQNTKAQCLRVAYLCVDSALLFPFLFPSFLRVVRTVYFSRRLCGVGSKSLLNREIDRQKRRKSSDWPARFPTNYQTKQTTRAGKTHTVRSIKYTPSRVSPVPLVVLFSALVFSSFLFWSGV